MPKKNNRTEPVYPITVRLTKAQRYAANNIVAKSAVVGEVEMESMNDAVGYSLVDVSRRFDEEFHIKSAATKPRM